MNFRYATISVFILSIVLTMMQSRSPNIDMYKAKRNQSLTDFAKLGGAYFVMTMTFRVVVYLYMVQIKMPGTIVRRSKRCLSYRGRLAVFAFYYITKGNEQNIAQTKNNLFVI